MVPVSVKTGYKELDISLTVDGDVTPVNCVRLEINVIMKFNIWVRRVDTTK